MLVSCGSNIVVVILLLFVVVVCSRIGSRNSTSSIIRIRMMTRRVRSRSSCCLNGARASVVCVNVRSRVRVRIRECNGIIRSIRIIMRVSSICVSCIIRTIRNRNCSIALVSISDARVLLVLLLL